MTTKRENILAAIKTALANTTGVGTRIYRSRVEPLARAESPAIVVEPLSDTPVQATSLPTLDWTLRVRISVIERATVPDQAADDTIESLHSKMMADLTLGGYAIDVQPAQTSFQLLEADQPAGVIFCEYEIKYRTEVNDLTQ
nr:phage minor tail protein U [uncultured Mediterranean phage uvMED]|tara:strand:- start:1152 stop:1577 length:426 start_codon:yes stop_codon:yes gene_type:complete